MLKFLKRLFGLGEASEHKAPGVQSHAQSLGTTEVAPEAMSQSEATAQLREEAATQPIKEAVGTNMNADYVIVGAGPAGIATAEELRKADPDSSILVLSGEEEPPYSRMAIPYVLTGLIGESGSYLRKTNDHYQSKAISVTHAKASAIDVAGHSVSLDDGNTCSYGKLIVATGASPIKPPVEGLELPGVHHCWTLEDARAIAERAAEGSDVVLMGAGFIGCIILEALVTRGVNLTVVEAEDRMVPRMMNDTAGNLIKKWCEDKGITVLTSTRVTQLTANEKRLNVELDNGRSTAADLVVVATGVRSNVEFLQGSGIEVNEGIKVNDRLQSSVEDIYAAGDCAEGPDFSTGGWSVHAIQPTATEHGRIAALNMVGKHARYKGSLNMNVLDTAGLISSSFGLWQGVDGGQIAEALDEDHYRYTRLAFDGGRLVGALTIGRTENIGILRGLIQSRTNLGVWEDRLMENPNRITEAYVANIQTP